jgi:PPOX class probable F420-dependent enzyme|tara:strand:- start:1383 stop:1733 length:351 start_codon:yes stop_codon:yes gene_type:complete
MVADIATIGPSGEPHCTPVWFDWDGVAIRLSLTTARQKYRNVCANPLVAMSLIDPDNPYRSMEVRSSVVDISDDSGNEFLNTLASRYMGIEEYTFDVPGTERVVVTLEPNHFTVWD